MKVLYDHQTFSLQDYGGISRIYTELIKHAPEYPEIQAELSILLSNNAYLKELGNIQFRNFLRGWHSYRKTRVMMAVNKVYSTFRLTASKADIFHPTYYDPYFLKHLRGKPFVVTFLDLIHERFGSRYPQLSDGKLMFDRKKIMLRHASKVIAISECTKKDIMQVFGTDASKIEVIHLGNSLRVKAKNKISRMLPSDYLLFVGNRGTYKNFDFFVTSCRQILLRHKQLKIVCAGGGKFSADEIELFSKLEISAHVLYVPIASDDTLISLYSYAACFIFPSLYEGFGIPVLEAFACSCPIVLSDRGSLPEVAGDAVLYCNPEDAESISSAINAYLSDASLMRAKAAQGSERLKQFSWGKTSNETFNIYKSLV